MISNTLYETITNTFEQYGRYESVITAKEKDLEGRKADIAKILIESDFEADIEQVAFETFTEIALYKNDLRIIGHKLYLLVNAYVELNLDPKLPEEVITLCTTLEPSIPKNNFHISEDLTITEKEKDFIKKVKETQVKSGAMKQLIDQLKNMIDV